MQIKHFIGIDVSKETLDLSVMIDGKHHHHYRIKNNTAEIKKVTASNQSTLLLPIEAINKPATAGPIRMAPR